MNTTVVSAVPQSNVTVRVTFSAAMMNNANLIIPEHYVFNGGLLATGAVRVDSTRVDIATSPQVGSKTYLLTVNPILQDAVGDPLTDGQNTATFAGITTPAIFVVQNLVARTHPSGNRIDLEWSNPSGAVYQKILRKSRGFPYDSSDGEVLYNGAAKLSHSDTGLCDTQFYYYLVLCSTDGVTWEHNEDSQVEGLSIRAINSAAWLWSKVIPSWDKLRQNTIVDGALLEEVVDVLGAGLDLIRGELEAYGLSSDLDRAPITLLDVWNRSINFLPETTFDHEALRRMPLHLIDIYKNKTTIPSILNLMWHLVQWEGSIVEFGGEEGTLFKTWDGSSLKDTNSGTAFTVVRGSLTDGSKSWTTNQWQDGLLRDGMGNLFNVLSNIGTVLTLEPKAQLIARVSLSSPSGQRVLSVDTTGGVAPYAYILISDGTNHQVAAVHSVQPNQSITLQEDLQYTFTTTARVYAGTDLLDFEILGTGTAISGGLQDLAKLWVTNMWRGYKLLDSANVKWSIIGNTATQVLVSGGNPAAGSYAIAFDFTLGGSFSVRQPHLKYHLYSGAHYFLYEPTLSPALIGTAEDPFDRLYAGVSGLGAGFTNDDYAIFVKSGVPIYKGKATSVALNKLTDSTASLTPGSLVGYYLNPNRKQRRMPKIISNTATEIFVDQSIEGIATTDDYYFVLNERDMLRYIRLYAVLPKFQPRFTRGYIFFD